MKSHQLDWISIEGFKSIASSGKIELRPINLVIGANGSGKSNFLNCFDLLHEFSKSLDRFKEYVGGCGGANELLHFGSKHTSSIRINFAIQGQQRLAFNLHEDGKDSFFRSSHNAGYDAEAQNGSLYREWAIHQTRKVSLQDTGGTSPLKRTNKTDDNDYLRPDGSNLAAFLYRLQIRFPNEYGMIVKTVQRIAPFFEDFLLRPDSLNPEFIKLAWTHKGTDKYFGASSLSDGTLRFIALTTLLMQPLELRPSVILIDEPELGLHPEAIGLLASLIKLASVDTQIIAATQSPALLDHFEPEDVLVAERVNGGTVFNRLNSEKLQIWLEDYSLGQLWGKNEIGGNPLPETRT
jgi:predicted ATPase